MKAYVTDTHPLVWFFAKREKLSSKVLKIFEDCENNYSVMYIPTPVIWEIGLLLRTGKIRFKMSLREWYQKLSQYKTFIVLPLEPETVIKSNDLVLSENEDPFDRIIVASALSMDCPLITVDGYIHDSNAVEIIW